MGAAAIGDCYACQWHAQAPSALPSRERVFDDGLWRVAHAFATSLAGWLVVVPRRHILSIGQLTPDEAAALGPLLAAGSRALEREFTARKAYVAFFGEAEGFEHLHGHVVPRLLDLPADRRGPGVFGYLGVPAGQQLSPDEMDRVADRLRPVVAAELEVLRGDGRPGTS
jgi:diadenosine tetraphosphate (Ap4A) HIT family hydrolase